MLTVQSKDGTKIAYDKAGRGPVVILVGGAFNTRSFGPNESLALLLAKSFTVVNYDRRGRGDSENTLPYNLQKEVDDIEALIDANGGSAYVYGISSGAALALEAANSLSQKVAKLAVFEAPYVVDSSRLPVPANFREHLADLIESDRRSEAIKYFMTKGVGLPGVFVTMMKLMPSWKQLKAVSHTAPYDAACLKSNSVGRQLDAKQWAHITAPTLVIVGGKSPVWMKNGMQELKKVLPKAEHRILEGQMHIVKATAMAPVLTEFYKVEEN